MRDIKVKFFDLQENHEFKYETCYEWSQDHVMKYVFGIIDIYELYDRMFHILEFIGANSHYSFLSSLCQFVKGLNLSNLNPEIILQVNNVIDTLSNYITFLKSQIR